MGKDEMKRPTIEQELSEELSLVRTDVVTLKEELEHVTGQRDSLREEVERLRRANNRLGESWQMNQEQNKELQRVISKYKDLVIFALEGSMERELAAAHGARMAEAAAKVGE